MQQTSSFSLADKMSIYWGKHISFCLHLTVSVSENVHPSLLRLGVVIKAPVENIRATGADERTAALRC